MVYDKSNVHAFSIHLIFFHYNAFLKKMKTTFKSFFLIMDYN